MSRIMRVWWIGMPGNCAVPTVIGSARPRKSGNSTWTFNDCAWKVAERPVIARKRLRTATRRFKSFLSLKSYKLLDFTAQVGGELLSFRLSANRVGYSATGGLANALADCAFGIGSGDPRHWNLRIHCRFPGGSRIYSLISHTALL